jgi:L-fuculose-phosphate aldolase
VKTTPAELRSQVVSVSRALHARAWVANHDGNVSVRLGPNRILCTPTAVSKGDVREDWLIVVDDAGALVSGARRPFSELALHRAAYEARPDVQAVVHAHPPNATAFAVAGRGLDRPIIAEAVVSLGPRVPLVPYALPGSPASVDGPRDALGVYDAVLLGNHGVLTVGADLEQALLRMELVEHLARIERLAHQLGGPNYLPDADVQRLLDARARAGLGPEARGGIDPHRAGDPRSAPPYADAALRRLIADELRAALRSDDTK